MATLFTISLITVITVVLSIITVIITVAFKNKSKKTKKEAQRKLNHRVEYWDTLLPKNPRDTYYSYVSQADYNKESSKYSPYSATGRSYSKKLTLSNRCDCVLYYRVDTNNANVYRTNNGDYSDRTKLYGCH